MRKIFFLFLLITVGLPSWAERASTVTMVTTFPVKYVSYDELYAQHVKLGLDRNTSPMLRIKQELKEEDLAGDRDFEALGQIGDGTPALRVSTTTINAPVALGNIDQLMFDDNTFTLPGEGVAGPGDFALARFGRASVRTSDATIRLGLGMRTLKLQDTKALPPIIAALTNTTDGAPCGANVAQWIQRGGNIYLGCDGNGNGNPAYPAVVQAQWARQTGLRQKGISDNNEKQIFRSDNQEDGDMWNWGGDAQCNDPSINVNPKEGEPCSLPPDTACVKERACEPEDGCLYVNENGERIDNPKVYERWQCVIPAPSGMGPLTPL